ncbi:MAG: hypothetical protein L0H75_00510 [Nitrosospira sp.]|nr:hypothetical protein [Nitrosospira sp.]MDN5934642.1 hypothetical protein [Nitrosospira sp.]
MVAKDAQFDTGSPRHKRAAKVNILADATAAKSGPKSRKIVPGHSPITGPVQFFSKLLEAWNINDLQSACMLLGYEESSESDVRDILSGRSRLETRDEKDRIAELFVIRKALLSVFQDRKVENQWLRERQEILGGTSPLDLLLEGSWPNLLRVRQLAELMAGL